MIFTHFIQNCRISLQKLNVLDLIERIFLRENSLYHACNEKYALFFFFNFIYFILHLRIVNILLCDLLKNFAKIFHSFLIIFLFALVLNINKYDNVY